MTVLARTSPRGPGSTVGSQTDTPDIATLEPLPPEEPSNSARAELALLQLFHGMAVGGELCALIDCDNGNDGGFPAAMTLLGGIGGLTASLVVGNDRVTPGIRGLLNSGTVWGAVNGTLLMIAADPEEDKIIAGGLLLSHTGGLLVGTLLASRKPTEGQVALTNTFGIWSGVLTLLAMNTLEADFDDPEPLLTLAAGADIGLIIGSFMAQRYRGSRGYTLLIDAGGIVGGLAGLAVASIIDEDPSTRLASATAMIGASIGLGLSAYLARRWQSDLWGSPRLTVIPLVPPAQAPTGTAWGAGVAFEM